MAVTHLTGQQSQNPESWIFIPALSLTSLCLWDEFLHFPWLHCLNYKIEIARMTLMLLVRILIEDSLINLSVLKPTEKCYTSLGEGSRNIQ